jgi:hypothetical protein
LDPSDPIWWTFDGETYQIEIFRSDPDVIKKCQDESIIVMKCCASATEIQNLLDDSKQFLTTKTLIKHCDEEDLTPFAYLGENIKRAFHQHDNDQDLVGTSNNKMPSWWIKTASAALLRV